MNEIVKIEKVQEFELMQRMGKLFFASKMFPNLQSEVQAIVKVMVGKELGLPPFASMSGIHVVQGKPILGSNLIATLIANHPRYNYHIVKSTKEICEIDFYDTSITTPDKDSKAGVAVFTIQEAQEAGLLGKDNWKKYASDMLFARCISRGAKRYTPGIFGGAAVYTADEMGIEVEVDEDGVIIREALVKKLETFPDANINMGEIIAEIKEVRQERDGIIPEKPIPGSDEAIIEEIKQTHAISEGGF